MYTQPTIRDKYQTNKITPTINNDKKENRNKYVISQYYHEKIGDILKITDNVIKGHCISKDVKMSEGIANDIKINNKGIQQKIWNRNPKIRDVILTYDALTDQLIANMITKDKYF